MPTLAAGSEHGAPTVVHCPPLLGLHRGRPCHRKAVRRREVLQADLGRRALALDDAAQGLTFTTRAGARLLLGRDATRERAELRAWWRAVRS